MPDETALAELLSMWEQEAAGGHDVPAAELCRDRPELAAELQRRIEAVRGIDKLARRAEPTGSFGAAGPESAPTVPAGGAPLPALPGYEVLGRLGAGGMGVVLRARDLALKRLVAVKLLPPAAPTAEGLARFRAEAEALARLRHPHVVQVYAAGEHGGRPYFVMEYVEGGGLDAVLGGRPQPTAEAARLVMLLARAVHAAHREGIVHRDLKPANVLLGPPADEPSLNTAYGLPKVGDFGLAKHLGEDQGLTAGGQVLGTPGYMAPEQAAGRPEDVGPPCDVYALGAILYELLTGRPPFRGRTVLETLDWVRTRPPTPPHELRPEVPPELEAICLRCLAKAPADRYPTALALSDDLSRFLAGRPAPVAPHRRRAGPAVAAAVLLAAAGLVAVGLYAAWPRGGPPSAGPGGDGGPPAGRAAPLKGWIDVRVWKSKDDAPLRLHQPGALPLRAGDHLRVEAELTRPAYLYVVWLETTGKAVPKYPWRGNDWGDRPADEAPRDRLALPEAEGQAAPLGGSPSGVESILLLAREDPLPAGEDERLAAVFAGLPPQQGRQAPRLAAWFENGEAVEDRGAPHLDKASDVGDMVLRTQLLLRDKLRPLFGCTRAVCYGFQGDERP
jgi:hypothetical protein